MLRHDRRWLLVGALRRLLGYQCIRPNARPQRIHLGPQHHSERARVGCQSQREVADGCIIALRGTRKERRERVSQDARGLGRAALTGKAMPWREAEPRCAQRPGRVVGVAWYGVGHGEMVMNIAQAIRMRLRKGPTLPLRAAPMSRAPRQRPDAAQL